MSDGAVPPLPAEVTAIAVRKVPRWGRTVSQMIGFGLVVLVLGGFLNGMAYYLARAMYPLSPLRAAAPIAVVLVCDLLVLAWYQHVLAIRAITRRGPLVMGYISDAKQLTKFGNVTRTKLSYRYTVDNVPYTRSAWIGRSEAKGLKRLPDRRDYVIVAHAANQPKRSVMWGFVFGDGGTFYPH